RIEEEEFQDRTHEGIGREQCLPGDSVTSILLNFLFNNSKLFDVVQSITGCERVGSFSGRVYRLLARPGYGDSWHDDWSDHRMIAVSVNLSVERYDGGVLQIRDRKSPADIQDVVNTGFGDAVIFRLADHLEHRVTNVEGTIPKTAFAGWFLAQPDFLSLLKC